MATLRKLLAVIAICGALVAALFGLTVLYPGGVVEALNRDRRAAAAFETAAAYVDQFAQETGELPASEEFRDWSSRQPDSFLAREIRLTSGGYDPEVLRKFGTPPFGSYLLYYWWGDGFEYYPSWTRPDLRGRNYYVLGSKTADALFAATSVIGLALTGWCLWPRRPRRARVTDSAQRPIPLS